MQTKLTLSIEKSVVEQAKEFSRRHHKSLSKLIEGYLRQVAVPGPEKGGITPLVSKLSGVISGEKVSRHKEEYAGYLAKKYR